MCWHYKRWSVAELRNSQWPWDSDFLPTNLYLQLPTRTWGPFEKKAGQSMGPVIYHILYKCSFPWTHYGGFLLCFHKTLCRHLSQFFPLMFSDVASWFSIYCVIFSHSSCTEPARCPLVSLLSVPYRDGNLAEHLPIQAKNDVSELCCSEVWHVGHVQKECAHLLGVSSKTPFPTGWDETW